MTEVKKHGMGTELVEPTWATLQLADVQALLAHYPQFQKVDEIVWHSPRPFSSAAIVKLDGTDYFVKRHANVLRDKRALQEEHGIIQHLQQKGIPVSTILKGDANETAFELGEWTYELHVLGTGVDLYRDAISWSPFLSTEHAYAAGEMLANVHVAAASYTGGKRQTTTLVSDFVIWLADDPLKEVTRFASQRPGLQAYLQHRNWQADFEQVLWPFYETFKAYKDVCTPLWTHNDWHSSNLLWTDHSAEAKVHMVLDFGLGNETSAIYDLATALERNVVEWLHIADDSKQVIHVDAAKALIAGYEQVKPLTTREREALAAIFPLVHTDFALSEIDYFTRVTNSEQDAHAAYDDFLLDHAKWCNSEQGQQLLRAIRGHE